ncbi:replication initiator [Parafrigoribacterium humi]|uniref:replication initiator n=1 Tax=Parafrigoribacterium humi TaxID=3144664 RepID=UPI0032EEEDA1
MLDAPSNLEPGAAEVIARGCARPIKTASGVWVRCGSRVKSRCPSCAELYRGDWAAIARSGVFDGPVENFQFYLLTLTAPSFGQVHRVPRPGKQVAGNCGCGVQHSADDAGLRGVPLDPARYDYVGQVAWNRDAGLLWDRTRRRVRDRWDSAEYFIVREWQDRGVLHVHVLVRIARVEAPTADVLREAARTAVAASKVDGGLVEWGAQARCDAFRANGDGAKTIWYLSKALNYVMKDVVQQDGSAAHPLVWAHLSALERAARSIRCAPDCVPASCGSRVHDRYGARSQVVSASRRTKHRTGWSFTGLTRTVQRRLRLEWFLSHAAPSGAADSATAVYQVEAVEELALRLRRELAPCSAAVP